MANDGTRLSTTCRCCGALFDVDDPEELVNSLCDECSAQAMVPKFADLKLYQHMAGKTRLKEPAEGDVRILAPLALCGEAGELANIVKKHFAYGHELDMAVLEEELGDLLWYVAEVATVYGLTLNDIARKNIVKLQRRYPDGYDTEGSHQTRDKK